MTTILQLPPLWSCDKKTSLPLIINNLGDNYKQVFFEGVNQVGEEWSITSPILNLNQLNLIIGKFTELAASTFLWSPDGVIPYQEYSCDEWKKVRVGINYYQIKATFKANILGTALLINP